MFSSFCFCCVISHTFAPGNHTTRIQMLVATRKRIQRIAHGRSRGLSKLRQHHHVSLLEAFVCLLSKSHLSTETEILYNTKSSKRATTTTVSELRLRQRISSEKFSFTYLYVSRKPRLSIIPISLAWHTATSCNTCGSPEACNEAVFISGTCYT